MYVCVCMYVCMYVRMYATKHVCCMHVCIYIRMKIRSMSVHEGGGRGVNLLGMSPDLFARRARVVI
jgi:hypothetical protein